MFKKMREILYRSLDNKEISYKKLEEIMRKNNNCLLLDVRSKQEFEEEHLNGAINIALYELEKQIIKLPDKQCIIIIYCRSGHRSRQAKEKLEKLGYKNIYNLKNGLDGM